MALIKSAGSAGRVRALHAPTPAAAPSSPSPPQPDPELTALRAEATARREAQARAETRLADQAADFEARLAKAREAARAEGYAAGRKAAEAASAQLEAGLAVAREQLVEDLRGLEGLAARLARQALDQVLGAAGPQADLVARVLRHQADLLQGQAVLAVIVSAKDFPQAADLEALAARLALPGVSIERREDLAAGDCQMRLQLGGLDCGLGLQRARLAEVLDALFQEGSAT